MPILELCAGYGGLGLAVQALTGDEVAYVAENDEAASLVLKHHWPDVPNIGDISAYDFAQLRGVVDKIAAGFPCQPVSNAGPRLGVLDERWLWPHLARAVRDIRPGHVFLENVAAIRSRGLSVLAEDLAALGYDLWWTTLRASAVGAAHHRDRWFGVAVPHTEGERRPARRAVAAEQQGQVRRLAGDGGQLPANPDRRGLAVGRLEPARAELQAAERSGLAPEDPDSSARDERGRSAPREAPRGGHGPTLDDEVSFLLPHAHSGGRNGGPGDEPAPQGRDEPQDGSHSPAEWWGEYLPAIRRWEERLAIPAPAPTELGPRGGRRLTALFAEWLMGIPGHVTDVPGLTRAQQLHKIGNGAMPQQAYAAYEHLLRQMKEVS